LEYTGNHNHKQKSIVECPDNFALIIGAMKSGTTSLFDILSQHPQICPSKTKEPDYFIKDRDDNDRENYLSLWDWKGDSHVVALESSVAYTKSPFITGVPERIKKSGLGRFKFIYMLREPLSRIESQARHALFAGWGQSLDTEISNDLIDFSRYAMQVDDYLKYFPKHELILITLEEFKSNPHEILKRICVFLEVDKEFRFSNVAEPRNSGEFFNASPVVAQVTQRGVGKFIAQKILSTKVKAWIRTIIIKLSKAKKKSSKLGRWKLNSNEEELIFRKLADDLKRLESEFGVDVRRFWNVPSKYLDRD